MPASTNRRRRTAFTLVELLIVIIILGILAAIVVPQFTSAAGEAQSASAETQIRMVESQLELFFFRNGRYPTLAEMTAAPTNAATDPTLGAGFGILVDQGYLKTAPRNPLRSNGTTIPGDWTYDAVAGTLVANPAS